MLAYSQSRLVGGLCLGDKRAKPGFSHSSSMSLCSQLVYAVPNKLSLGKHSAAVPAFGHTRNGGLSPWPCSAEQDRSFL